MRGLFYQRRPWLVLNCTAAVLALLVTLFFHGVLNFISVSDSTIGSSGGHLNAMLTSPHLYLLLAEAEYWAAQVTAIAGILTNLSLWLHPLLLGFSLAIIILIWGLTVLLRLPRWVLIIVLLALGISAMILQQQGASGADSLRSIAQGPAMGLYFTIAALIASIGHLRGRG